jgi:hypothetical protein
LNAAPVQVHLDAATLQDGSDEIIAADSVQTQSDVATEGRTGEFFRLFRDGGQIHVTLNDSSLFVGEWEQVANLSIQGSEADDTLIVDMAGGNPIPLGGPSFDAGDNGDFGDRLIIQGGAADTVAHELHATGGTVRIDGATITYTGVEPMTDSLFADVRTISVTGAVANLTLSAGDLPGTTTITTSETAGLTFTNPTQSLSIEVAEFGSGSTEVTVGGLGAGFAADLKITAPDGHVRFAGDVDLGGGSLNVTAASVTVDQSLTTDGGDVRFAADRVTISTSARLAGNEGAVDIQANDIEHHGVISVGSGNATLNAGASGTLQVSGVVEAKGAQPGTLGGTIHLLGDRVELIEQAQIDASGDAGGGTVLIGGDFQGANPDLLNATETTIEHGAVIRADAVSHGNGERIIVWADGMTRFYGTVSATGGAAGGDGGFAEISGKESLVYRGAVNLRAAQGHRGTVLFDPKNIVIDDVGGDSIGGNQEFNDSPNADVAFLNTDLVALLNGADVVLQANNDITFAADVNTSDNDPGSLTLQAGRSILFQADVAVTLQGSFTATANDADATPGQRDAGNAVITMAASSAIVADDGITLQYGTGPNNNPTGAMSLRTLDAGTIANVTIVDTTAVDLQTLNVSGDLSVTAGGHITDSGTLVIDGAITLAAGAANNITLDEAANEFSGTVFVLSGNNATLSDAGAVELGTVTLSGNLSVTAGGPITNSGTLTIAGTTTLSAGAANNIALGVPANDFTGAVSVLSGNDVTIVDANAVELGTMNVAGILSVTAGGAITDSGTLTVVGAATFVTRNNSGADILLNSPASTFGALTLRTLNAAGTAAAAGNIAVVENGIMQLNVAETTAGVDLSSSDAIIDANGAATNIIAASAVLTAATGIGAGNPLETAIAQLGASGGTGGVEIDNGGDLTIAGVSATGGSIHLTTVGAMIVDEAVQNTAGPVALVATSNILINDQVLTTGGSLTMQAAGGITVNENVTIAGTVTLNADSDNDGAGTLRVADGATIRSTDNPLLITAADLDLNATGALDSGTGPLTITASNDGSIGLGASPGDLTISGGELENISAGALTLVTTGAGNILVDGITAGHSQNIAGLTTLRAAGTGNVNFVNNSSTFRHALAVRADGGDVVLDVDLTIEVGDVTLTADGGTSDVIVNSGLQALDGSIAITANRDALLTAGALIDAGERTITLTAGDNIILSGQLTTDTTASAVSLTADNDLTFTATAAVTTGGGDVDVTATSGSIAFAAGAVIDAGAGTIMLTAGKDITLGRLVTTNDTNRAVSITSRNGAVLDGGDSGGADVEADQPGAVVTIVAHSGIGRLNGSTGALDTAVYSLELDVTKTGDIHIREQSDLELLDVTTYQGDFHLRAGGEVTLAAGSMIETNRHLTVPDRIVRLAPRPPELKVVFVDGQPFIDSDDPAFARSALPPFNPNNPFFAFFDFRTIEIPQIKSDGSTSLTVVVGSSMITSNGEVVTDTNLAVTIDWDADKTIVNPKKKDGYVEPNKLVPEGGRPETYKFQYDSNDAINRRDPVTNAPIAAEPFVIRFSIEFAPSISIIQNTASAPLVLTNTQGSEIPQTDDLTFELGLRTGQGLGVLPGEGFATAYQFETPALRPQFVQVDAAALPASATPFVQPQSQPVDFGAGTQSAEEEYYILQRYSRDGSRKIGLPSRSLPDDILQPGVLLGYLNEINAPDGRYRIYLVRVDGTLEPNPVREVFIENGQLTDIPLPTPDDGTDRPQPDCGLDSDEAAFDGAAFHGRSETSGSALGPYETWSIQEVFVSQTGLAGNRSEFAARNRELSDEGVANGVALVLESAVDNAFNGPKQTDATETDTAEAAYQPGSSVIAGSLAMTMLQREWKRRRGARNGTHRVSRMSRAAQTCRRIRAQAERL